MENSGLAWVRATCNAKMDSGKFVAGHAMRRAAAASLSQSRCPMTEAIKVGDKVETCVWVCNERRPVNVGYVVAMSFDGSISDVDVGSWCGVLHGYTKRSRRTYERLNMTEAGWTRSVGIVVMLFTCADVCLWRSRSAVGDMLQGS